MKRAWFKAADCIVTVIAIPFLALFMASMGVLFVLAEASAALESWGREA